MAKVVYFGFDYEDVSDFRANVVRNHNMIDGTQKKGFIDGSIWEEAKKKDLASLKRLINSELEGTTVTAILIGTGTYARHWVRYEIFKSMARGNMILGIHINSIRDKEQKTKPLGIDPFEHLAVRFSADGKSASPMEWNGSAWVDFTELGSWTINEQPQDQRGQAYRLSRWYKCYDWVGNDGYNNFSKWIK